MKKIGSCTTVFILFTALMLVLFIVLPSRAFSEKEKRVLETLPAPDASSLLDGSWSGQVEDAFADHFPLRDFFVGIHSYVSLALGQNSARDVIKGKDGYLFAAPAEYDTELLKRNIGHINDFAKKNSARVIVTAVPESGWVNDELLPKNHPEYRDEEMLDIIKSELDGAEYMDFAAAAVNTPDIYYSTDHHLNSRGAYELYKQFCKTMELDYQDENCYNIDSYEGFCGTAYSASGLWLTHKDSIELWDDGGTYKVTADGTEHDGLFFTEYLGEADMYPVYIDGNHALTHIENPNGEGSLVVIKDSFAHCAAGFLAAEYRDIYLVDLRYYKLPVSQLLEDTGTDTVLVLYGVMNLTTDSGLAWLE